MEQATLNNFENFEVSGRRITPSYIAELAEEASQRLNGFITETPLVESEFLSYKNARVLVKDEAQQPGGSFKDRGAGNGVFYHGEKGVELVVTSSAGNHARGMGRAALQAGMKAVAVVPRSANQEKKEAVSKTGAELHVHGKNFDEALEYGQNLANELGGQFIHPFADPIVIAGQATLGLDILRQSPDVTHVVLPVGGGGMLAGVASVIKEYKENVQVIAAQVERNTAFVDSFTVGIPLRNQPVAKRFEGLAVGNVDPLNFMLAKKVVDATIVVDQDEIFQTIYNFKNNHGTLLEPAGGASPTAAKKVASMAVSNEMKIVAVGSGGNTPDLFSKWLDRRALTNNWN